MVRSDFNTGRILPLDFISGEDESRPFVEVTVPRLEYCEMIAFKVD
jgi:aromatic ring-opening dioxygenase LigB subunit